MKPGQVDVTNADSSFVFVRKTTQTGRSAGNNFAIFLCLCLTHGDVTCHVSLRVAFFFFFF